MEGELTREGFGAICDYRSSRYVRLERSAGLLEETLVVTWIPDREGKLTTVEGYYGLTGP